VQRQFLFQGNFYISHYLGSPNAAILYCLEKTIFYTPPIRETHSLWQVPATATPAITANQQSLQLIATRRNNIHAESSTAFYS
jgi:hypothetical protein